MFQTNACEQSPAAGLFNVTPNTLLVIYNTPMPLKIDSKNSVTLKFGEHKLPQPAKQQNKTNQGAVRSWWEGNENTNVYSTKHPKIWTVVTVSTAGAERKLMGS